MTRRQTLLVAVERYVESDAAERERVARDAALLALVAAGVSRATICEIMRSDHGVRWREDEIRQRAAAARKRRDAM